MQNRIRGGLCPCVALFAGCTVFKDEYIEVKPDKFINGKKIVQGKWKHKTLKDVDLWVPSASFQELSDKVTSKGELSAGVPIKVPGGWEWPAGSALGNIHELDVRDGQRVWGEYGVLNYAKNIVYTGIPQELVGGNTLFVQALAKNECAGKSACSCITFLRASWLVD